MQRCKESGFSFLACNDGVGSLCISPTEYCTGKVDISDPQTVTVSGRNRNGEEVTLECPYSDDPLSRVPADSALVETCRMLEGEVIHVETKCYATVGGNLKTLRRPIGIRTCNNVPIQGGLACVFDIPITPDLL